MPKKSHSNAPVPIVDPYVQRIQQRLRSARLLVNLRGELGQLPQTPLKQEILAAIDLFEQQPAPITDPSFSKSVDRMLKANPYRSKAGSDWGVPLQVHDSSPLDEEEEPG